MLTDLSTHEDSFGGFQRYLEEGSEGREAETVLSSR